MKGFANYVHHSAPLEKPHLFQQVSTIVSGGGINLDDFAEIHEVMGERLIRTDRGMMIFRQK